MLSMTEKRERMLSKISEYIKVAQEYTKFAVAVIGGLLTVAAGFIPSEWSPLIQTIVAALTAFSVYQVPNVVREPAEA